MFFSLMYLLDQLVLKENNSLLLIFHLNLDFQAIFFHADCDSSARRNLWSDLSNVLNPHIPTIILGDFNVILKAEDKLGGNPFQYQEEAEFQDFIFSNSLIDLGFLGSPYTWCNNRFGTARIYKRLNRGLINPCWQNLNLQTSISHLARVASDHSPLLLELKESDPLPRKSLGSLTSGPFDQTSPILFPMLGVVPPPQILSILSCSNLKKSKLLFPTGARMKLETFLIILRKLKIKS